MVLPSLVCTEREILRIITGCQNRRLWWIKNVQPVKGEVISITFHDVRKSNRWIETAKGIRDGVIAIKEQSRY